MIFSQYHVYSIWFDTEGNTYTAGLDDERIRRISPTGDVEIVYPSDKGAPVSGLFDREGNMWILEVPETIDYTADIRKVDYKHVIENRIPPSNKVIYLLGVLAFTLAIFYIITRRSRKKDL